jgi:YkoY family integral membrane protein
VLALLVRHLPEGERGRALRFGLIGAFVFRAIGVLLAVWLIHFWFLKAAGAAWLLFLSIRHFVWRTNPQPEIGGSGKGGSFWMTVLWVELTDIAFSIDSILAAVAMSPNIYIVYLGGILGIVAMRFVAGIFLKLLDRYPGLETAAYLIIAWIGIKLGLSVYAKKMDWPARPGEEPGVAHWLFWVVMVLLFVGGLGFSRRKKDPQEAEHEPGP